VQKVQGWKTELMASEAPKTALGMVAVVFGLFAGLASLVVILGGSVLAFRLRTQGLPADAVVAVLPREFLISVGLGVTIQLVAFLLALLLGFVWQRVDMAMAAAWVGATLLAYPFLRIATGYGWLLLVAAWVATAFVLSGFILWGHRKWGSTREALPIVSLIIVGLVVFVPWRGLFEWRSAEGLDALVCVVGEGGITEAKPFVGGINGLFIGENENSVYIGEKHPSGGLDPRIAEVPRVLVGLVLIGENADEETCERVGTSSRGQR
jgi:hypothetical protein